MIKKIFTMMGILEQRLRGSERVSYANILGKVFQGVDSKCKGPGGDLSGTFKELKCRKESRMG